MILYQVVELKRVKRKYLVIIKTDKSEEDYLLSEDLLVEYRLVKGKELEKKTYQSFKESYKRDELYQKVLHYALYKQRCTYEVIEYLTKRDILKQDQIYYLNKLRNARILDDASYTKNFIQEAFEFKKYGLKKIVYELKQKHIDSALYEKAISQIKTSQVIDNINFLYQKKLRSTKNKSTNKAIQDIKQFIIRKGYDYSLVNQTIESKRAEIANSVSEDDALDKDYLIAKKKYSKKPEKEYQNILSYLLRKGYTYNKIKERMGG
ncbi:RecX family transcriptional regulator [Mycoplasmatota bacterium WC30]